MLLSGLSIRLTPAGKRLIAFPPAQALARQMNRHQRGRTRGVDHHRRAVHTQEIRQAAQQRNSPHSRTERRGRNLPTVSPKAQVSSSPRWSEPTKTEVWVPRIAGAVMPAFSSASQATSSSSRCWGSIAAASRGEIPKNSASNSFGCQAVRKPPSRLQIVPGGCGPRSSRRPRPSGPSGTRTMPLRPVVQQPPVLGGGVHPAGKPAPHAHHRNWFGVGTFGDLQASSQIVDLAQRLGDDRPTIRRCGSHRAQPSLSESSLSRSSSLRSS